jgi:predicted nucleic acid-binding protein
MKQMKDSFFIDSNIFLYAFSDKDGDKQKVAKDMQPNQIIDDKLTIINPFEKLLKK